jgi:pectin methylesterase-like acyl-CoA thioesterase
MPKRMRNAVLVLTLLLSGAAQARTVIVSKVEDKGEFTTIAAALTAAKTSSDIDRIFVLRDTYSESITLVKNVILEGEETAATILTAPIAFTTGATLQRFTIKGLLTLTGITAGTIQNNIFTEAPDASIKIDIRGVDDQAVRIVNNTFVGTGTNTASTAIGSLIGTRCVVSRIPRSPCSRLLAALIVVACITVCWGNGSAKSMTSNSNRA